MEFLDPNNDVIEYELVDDGNSNDEYFLVRQYYKNGYIKEVSVKADDKKVILSDSETSTIKDIQVGKTIPMNEAQETEYNLLMEKQQNRVHMGSWADYINGKQTFDNKNIGAFSNKTGSTFQVTQKSSGSTHISYEVFNRKSLGSERVCGNSLRGNYEKPKRLHDGVESKSYSSPYIKIKNLVTTRTHITGNLYIS